MNLESRNGLWYAVLTIPAELRDHFGRLRFVQSLKTRSKSDAVFRSGPVLTEWRAEIRKARGQEFDLKASEAQHWRSSLKSARNADEQAAIESLIEDRAGAITKQRGIEAASNFYKEALGLTTPLQPLYLEWKAQMDLAPKTVDQMGRDVGKLVEHFGNLQRVTPKAVKGWTDELVKEGATHSSLKRMLGSGRSFWKYLQSTSIIELDATDPFVGMIRLTSAKVERNKKERKAFTAVQVAALYSAAIEKDDKALGDLIAMAAFSGARIEELCSLKAEDVVNGFLNIADAKTTAGIREVPIHPAIAALVARLAKAAGVGYLIKSTAAGKYGVRSDPLSKRFGRLKTGMGYGEDHVFHSIRKTVTTLLEQAGVVEGIAADIVGHEKPTMTYGLYSDGTGMKQKMKAIRTVSYPAPLGKP
jgi:integrase